MATAESEKEFSQMPELAENSMAIVVGYHVIAAVLAMICLPYLVGETWLLVLYMIGLVLTIGIPWWFVLGMMKGKRLAWHWGRYLALFGAVVRTIASLAFVILAHTDDAEGIALLPSGPIGWLVVKTYGDHILELFAIVFFTLDIGTTIAGYVLFVALGNKRALAHFDLICPECNTRTTKGTDFFFTKARCRACQHTW
jgi:hypothetical protein